MRCVLVVLCSFVIVSSANAQPVEAIKMYQQILEGQRQSVCQNASEKTSCELEYTNLKARLLMAKTLAIQAEAIALGPPGGEAESKAKLAQAKQIFDETRREEKILSSKYYRRQ